MKQKKKKQESQILRKEEKKVSLTNTVMIGSHTRKISLPYDYEIFH